MIKELLKDAEDRMQSALAVMEEDFQLFAPDGASALIENCR